MMNLSGRTIAILVATAIGLGGCASTPRGFVPVLAATPADQAAYEAAFRVCSDQVAAGRRDSFRAGRGGSALGGAAIGGGAALVTGASAASGAGMLSGVAAGAGLMTGMIVFAPLAIYGVSRVQRARKEGEIQAAMAACLAEDGYAVGSWRLQRERGAMASPTRAAPAAAAD
jgi:hypothetical protein